VLAACSADESGSAEELCAELASEGGSLATTFEGFDPTDTDAALDQLRQARVALGDLQDVAPGDVRDDLTIEIEYVQALIDGLVNVEAGQPAQAVAVVQQVTGEHPDVQAASDRLEAWASQTC